MDKQRIFEAIYKTWQTIGSDVVAVTGPTPTMEEKIEFISQYIDVYGGDEGVSKFFQDDPKEAERMVTEILIYEVI